MSDLKQHLEDIVAATTSLSMETAARRFLLALTKYRPDQPRAPAGIPEGGQWIDDDIRRIVAQRKGLSEDECWDIYSRDTFHCTMVGLACCHRQAAQRYAACLAGKPIPSLNY